MPRCVWCSLQLALATRGRASAAGVTGDKMGLELKEGPK